MLVKQLSPGTAVVSSKELGTNCWLPCRFVKDDGRCNRIFTCSYPEKKRCEAVKAEITALQQQQFRLATNIVNIGHTIRTLENMLEKGM